MAQFTSFERSYWLKFRNLWMEPSMDPKRKIGLNPLVFCGWVHKILGPLLAPSFYSLWNTYYNFIYHSNFSGEKCEREIGLGWGLGDKKVNVTKKVTHFLASFAIVHQHLSLLFNILEIVSIRSKVSTPKITNYLNLPSLLKVNPFNQ